MKDMQQRVAASFARQGLMNTLNAELVLVTEGEVHIALPFSTQLSQQQGYIHAGAITSVVDSAYGYAALTKALPMSSPQATVASVAATSRAATS